jgi:hypothetical protein
MGEKETLAFKIGLSRSSDKKPTEFKISINGNNIVHSKLSKSVNETEYFEFSHDITEGDNTLEISLLNKGFGDTVLDSDGNIISDLLLNIDSVEIDEIDLGSLKWTLSQYEPIYPERYRVEAQKRGEDLSSSVKNCVNLGWNGTWKLPFTSPFYIWLLENI